MIEGERQSNGSLPERHYNVSVRQKRRISIDMYVRSTVTEQEKSFGLTMAVCTRCKKTALFGESLKRRLDGSQIVVS